MKFDDMKRNTYKLLVIIIAVSMVSCEKDVSVSPEEEKPVNGMLFVDSNPSGAEIYLDGKNTGDITPDTIFWLKEKNYKLTLKLPLFKDSSVTVPIKADQVTSRFLDYTTNPSMRGAVYLESNPIEADIYIGDSATGLKTPTMVKNLFPGSYQITYKKAGCWPETINIQVESIRTKYYFTPLADTTDWVVYNKKRVNLRSESLRYIAIERGWIKWIASFGAGVIRYDDSEWQYFDVTNSPLPSNNVSCVYIDRWNRKLFTTDFGLAILNNNTWTVYNTANSGLPSDNLSSVAVDEDGIIWIGTFGDGMVKFDGSEWTHYNTENSMLPHNIINMVYIGPANSKWFGTAGGGLVLINDYSQWKIYNVENTIRPAIPPRMGFPNDNISSISIAPDGLKWVAFSSSPTAPGGSAYSRFAYWNPKVNLPSPDVLFVTTDLTTVTWFGTFDEGITRLQGGVWENFDPSNSPMPSKIVYSIAVDANNDKWIATLGGGLVKYKKD